ncbi:hypothetical protein ACVDHH_02140 [Staphylococcus saprophyticus]
MSEEKSNDKKVDEQAKAQNLFARWRKKKHYIKKMKKKPKRTLTLKLQKKINHNI